MKLFMITGLGSASDLASGKRSAFYYTLEEFGKYWERIDILSPRIKGQKAGTQCLFGNVFIYTSSWPLLFHPVWFLKKGLEIFNEQKFDLMTVQEFPPFYNGVGARLLWQIIKVPYVLEIMHIPGHPRASGIKEEIYKQLMKWFVKYDVKNAKAVRVINQKETPDFLVRAGVPKKKIKYIPAFYIDLEVFKPITNSQSPITKLYDLIFIGRLVENKGINLLLEAVNNVRVRMPNVKVLIVGTGPGLGNLKFKIETLKLQDNILLHGWASGPKEIARLLNESRLLIMPSFNEGGPRVVLEAMACGVPVLATPVGIVPDLLKNGLGGAIIDWNAKDIAHKIQGFLSDFEAYEKHRLAAIEIASQFEKKAAIRNYAEQLKAQFLDSNF